jgi:hypothetical protein
MKCQKITSFEIFMYWSNIWQYGGQGSKKLIFSCGCLLIPGQDIGAFHSLVTHDGVGGKQAPELMMQAHVVVLFLRKQLVFLSPFINLNYRGRLLSSFQD